MINLLPPTVKENFTFARRNRHLLHWVFALSFGILGALIITAFGYLYLNQGVKSYQSQVTSAQAQLQKQDFDGVQTKIKDISNNLQLVVQVLSTQVVFSELLKQLGAITPRDTNLTGLAISQSQGVLDITAQAKDYSSATQLNTNLNDKNNQIFSKADIVTINCQSTADEYPCVVSIRALFAPNNPFMFIHETKKGSI